MAKKDSASADAGVDQVQATVDAENAQGFRGTKVDPTPNEHYTVAGVTAGKPTPETDAAHADTVAAHTAALARGEVTTNA